MKISGAERGFLLLKQGEAFEYMMGMDGSGQRLPQSDFQTSQSALRQVARGGKPVFMTEGIEGEFASQQSVLDLRLRSLACMPLQWISQESDAHEVKGVLYLDSTGNMRALSTFDEKLLGKLALEAGNVFEKLTPREVVALRKPQRPTMILKVLRML